MAVPITDTGLLSWSATFNAGITTAFATYGLTSAQQTAFDGFYDVYATALAAWQNDPDRSKNLTAAKHTAKGNLLANARQLYDIVKHHPGLTDAQLIALGVHVDKTEDTPAPVLSTAPVLTVKSIFGRQFTLSIKAVGEQSRQAIGASGATLYSFVGATPPEGSDGWTSEGNFGKSMVIVALPPTVTPGTRVWFAANWYNARHVSPGCTAVMTQVGVEGSLAA
ncbi:MAG: hypothetical protein WBD40_12855 [Tepidisphaeraceae bacterium]